MNRTHSCKWTNHSEAQTKTGNINLLLSLESIYVVQGQNPNFVPSFQNCFLQVTCHSQHQSITEMHVPILLFLFSLKNDTANSHIPLSDWSLYFNFFYMKGISGLSFLSPFPSHIPVSKTLIVFPQSFFNLPVMRWKMWKMFFLSKTNLSTQSPSNLCVCVCGSVYMCTHLFICVLLLTLPLNISVCEVTHGGRHLFSWLCGFLCLWACFAPRNISRVQMIRITTWGYSYY